MDHVVHRTAHEVGYTRDNLRTLDWRQPTDGVSLRRDKVDDLPAVCAAIAPMLGHDAVFTHLTSAVLRGWWLPRIDPTPIIACTHGEAPHLDRRGVYIRRCDLPTAHRDVRRGLPVASAEWTIVELAEHLSFIDLVVVIDCALHRGETTVERIRATMRKGRRGVRVLRRALDVADGRSESPWETLLRLLHVLSGIAVDPQFTRRDEAGEIIWRLDLLIRGTRRGVEFDGGNHLHRDVQRRDLRRARLLARDGIERYGYSQPDVIDDPMTILRDALDALGLAHDPGRLKLWLHEIERSTFKPSGYGALLRRLRRFDRRTTPRPSSGAR